MVMICGDMGKFLIPFRLFINAGVLMLGYQCQEGHVPGTDVTTGEYGDQE